MSSNLEHVSYGLIKVKIVQWKMREPLISYMANRTKRRFYLTGISGASSRQSDLLLLDRTLGHDISSCECVETWQSSWNFNLE